MSTSFLVQEEKFHMPEFPSKQTVSVIHEYVQASSELTELMILLDKTKPQTLSWPFASGSLHYCFLPAIALSCLSLVPQHCYASKRWADYPSLSFCGSRCLSDMLWLQLSRVERPKCKKKIPRVLWSPLLLEAVQLKQDVWSQSMPAVLTAVWFSKLTLKLCWDAEPKGWRRLCPQ